MNPQKVLDRRLVVVGAILIQLCLGAIYAWSVFTKQLTLPVADGGYGFSEEYPAAKAFRDARVTRLYEGTTEICRLTAIRRVAQLVASADAEPATPDNGASIGKGTRIFP